MLSDSQLSDYQQQGYLVLPHCFSLEQMQTLKTAANKIVEEFDSDSTRSIFSTKSADTSRDDYFLTSGDKVRCFFEEDAFDAEGNLKQNKHLSINKIGHALHVLSPVFRQFSRSPRIVDIAKALGLVTPEIRQSMYIFKQPRIGGEVRWHQDATYFYTTPMSVITFWFAIEDATLHNGCLQVMQEGGQFPLKEQFKRYTDDRTELVTLKDIAWPSDASAHPLEVKAGSLVVFAGNLPHFSAPNHSAHSRHAFTLHITDGQAEYSSMNWLQAEPTPLLQVL